MATSQDGPVRVGGTQSTGVAAELLLTAARELVVTGGGSGGIISGSFGFDTSVIYNGTTALIPKFKVISCSTSGDNTLVAGVALKKIRVVTYLLSVSASVNAKFQSSTAGDLTGLFYFAANSGATAGFCANGHFETVAGEDLQLNLSGAVPVGGHLLYVEV